jgi:hypothetical protein
VAEVETTVGGTTKEATIMEAVVGAITKAGTVVGGIIVETAIRAEIAMVIITKAGELINVFHHLLDSTIRLWYTTSHSEA